MLVPVGIYLVVLLMLTWRAKGPVWTMALSWLVCFFPILIGMVRFRYLTDWGHHYSFQLISYLSAFAFGAWAYALFRQATADERHIRTPAVPVAFLAREAARVRPVMRVCWWIAIASTGLNLIDFALLGGEGLSDLAALRDTYVNKSSASIYAQLASLGTWACLLCYIYGVIFRKQIRRGEFFRMVLPIVGFFSLSVLSAGRQAAFQIMLVTIILAVISRSFQARETGVRRPVMISRGEKITMATLSALMIGYMGFIAVARNDGGISDDKSVVLEKLFEFQFAPWADNFFRGMGAGLRGAIVEGIIYFSSAVGLFENFLNQNWKVYWGEISFPFLSRQIERLIGAPLVPALTEKVDTLNASGVIGVGWTTGISSYILDFGLYGAYVFMFILGYYSQKCWMRLLIFRNFYDVVVGVIVIMTALYMPLIPGFTETNVFLLWAFAAVLSIFSGNQRAARPVGAPIRTAAA